MATKAEIIQSAAKSIKAKIAEIEIAEQSILAGGKFVSVGGMQYNQENLKDLRNLRSKLCEEIRTLARKA